MQNTIRKFIVANQVVDMIYISGNLSITKRIIKPCKVMENSFIGFCYLRRSFRVFKYDNILALLPICKKEKEVSDNPDN